MAEARPPIHAAGAVLWRPGSAGPEVALVHRPKYDDWTFPKGKLKDGEHVLRAAVREVAEETGLTPLLGRRLPRSSYMKDGRPKQVDYWAATVAAGNGFVPNDEVDRIIWSAPAEAEQLLSYPRDVDLLREFAAGPALTRPVVILRHGSAGDKGRWREHDALRPLDSPGRAEALALADLLAGYGPVRLVASATARCTETLLPYAQRARVSVVTDLAFTVGHTDAATARSRLAGLLDDGVSTVVCTHGELVGELVAELCDRLGEKRPDDPSLRKGGFWVAHLAAEDPALAALERHTARP
ncbi:NUDIX hydrolase [Actinomadura craniellae]|uniref:NUDIX hydrolase n=1 Tax=Actinomadura craniellae TaxID=2231787 RepID=A0A365GWX8_9ACTN|nr:NUDIX domain-containing protein [Actinomadura craniellae]RAY11268.1 NUDIX hydrolase [Actinomadura craniellae]